MNQWIIDSPGYTGSHIKKFKVKDENGFQKSLNKSFFVTIFFSSSFSYFFPQHLTVKLYLKTFYVMRWNWGFPLFKKNSTTCKCTGSLKSIIRFKTYSVIVLGSPLFLGGQLLILQATSFLLCPLIPVCQLSGGRSSPAHRMDCLLQSGKVRWIL